MSNTQFVLTLACPDQPGIVHSVSGFLLDRSTNIIDSMQHGDAPTGTFTMRIDFAASAGETAEHLSAGLAPVATRFDMHATFHDVARVGHSLSADDLAEVGREVEQFVFARALRWKLEYRIVLVGHCTVVFR